MRQVGRKSGHWARASVLILALGWTAWGCGGEAGPECGPGTRIEGDRCVPELDACAPGTVLQDGQCVPACPAGEAWDGQACRVVTRCEPGTRLDEATGRCVPACAAGTYWDGQACADVPDCGPGTVFDPGTGGCRPSEEACGPGAIWQDGACLPELACGPGTHQEGAACVPDRLPEPDVWEAPVDGATAEFDLPAAGGLVRLGGLVDLPEDKNEDGYPDGDWDAFAFEAPAGAWLRISATSEGAALPAFLLDGREDAGLGDLFYRRVALCHDAATSSREVYLPRAGRYLLWVSDHNQAAAFLFGHDTLPVGGPAFTYLVTVENLGTPEPVVLSLPYEVEHSFADGALGFYALDPQPAGAAVELTARPLAPAGLRDADVYPALLLMDEASALMDEYVSYRTWESAALLTSATAAGRRLVVRDFFAAIGSRPEVAFLARRLEPTPCTPGGCSTVEVSQQESRLLRFSLAAGDFFVAGTYFDPMGETMAHQQLVDGAYRPLGEAQMTYPGLHAAVWAYADRASAFHLWLRWGDGGPAGVWSLDARVHPTGTLTAGGTVSNQPVFDMPPGTLRPAGILHFSGQAGKLVFLTQLATQGAGWAQPFEAVWNARLEQEGPVVDVNAWNFPDGYATPLFTYIRDAGHHLYYLYDQQGDPSGGTYGLRMNAYDVTPLGRPVVGTPVRRNNISPNGRNFYSFEAGRNQVVDITVDPVLLSDIQARIWVLNFGAAVWDWIWYRWVASPDAAQLGLVVAETAGAPGDDFTARYVSPYDGLSVLLVMDEGGQAGPLDLFNLVLEVPPPPAHSACASAEALSLVGGEAHVTGSSLTALDDVGAWPGCGLGAAPGPDVYYRLTLAPGDLLEASLDSNRFAAVLSLFRDCADPSGSCVAGSDQGNPERIAYLVPAGAGGTYFLGVDGNRSGGEFQLDVRVTRP
jgi:hypothetical protein